MQPYQMRVKLEEVELNDKVTKLNVYTQSNAFRLLPMEDQQLLNQQKTVMFEYQGILLKRIERFR